MRHESILDLLYRRRKIQKPGPVFDFSGQDKGRAVVPFTLTMRVPPISCGLLMKNRILRCIIRSKDSDKAFLMAMLNKWPCGTLPWAFVNLNFWKGNDAIKSSPSQHEGQVKFSCFTHWSKHLRWKRWWQHLVLIVLAFSWHRQTEQIIESWINELAYIIETHDNTDLTSYKYDYTCYISKETRARVGTWELQGQTL